MYPAAGFYFCWARGQKECFLWSSIEKKGRMIGSLYPIRQLCTHEVEKIGNTKTIICNFGHHINFLLSRSLRYDGPCRDEC